MVGEIKKEIELGNEGGRDSGRVACHQLWRTEAAAFLGLAPRRSTLRENR
jgi:hypothetical protein